MATPLEISAKAPDQLKRVRTTHDALVDLILAAPELTQRQLAEKLGRTPQWVYLTINSTVFQERLAERKTELLDPTIMASLEDKLGAVAARSAELLLEKLNMATDVSDLTASLNVATRALGYGAGKTTNNSVTNFVVALPPKEASQEDWLNKYSPQAQAQRILESTVLESIEANEVSTVEIIEEVKS